MASVITRPLAPLAAPYRPRRARTAPVVLRSDGVARLERISLSKGEYSEKWLQDLVHDHPELLAVADIEPAFGHLIPVAREIPCGHGIIDNLFITPSGEIVLVEVKLWRNPQARREVVAQALDYVTALMATDYQLFEQQVLKAHGGSLSSLYTLAADEPEVLDERDFIDAVARNLSRGRMLVLVVGDGIHQEAEALAARLQSHAGAHFTFALIQVATYRDVITNEIIAVPDVLAQTVMIERGVVIIEDGKANIQPVPDTVIARPQSISEELFYEQLAKRHPKLPQQLKAFIADLAPLGVYADFRATLGLKVDIPDQSKPLSLGYITRTGKLWTENVLGTAPADAGLSYLRQLAELVDGRLSDAKQDYVSTDGKSAPTIDQLLPAHADDWRTAIEQLVAAARSVSN